MTATPKQRATHSRWPRWAQHPILLILLGVLGASADTLTTWVAIAHQAEEANPLIAWLIGQGAWWAIILIKGGEITLLAGFVLALRRWQIRSVWADGSLWLALGVLWFPVVWNLLQLAR